MMPKSNKTLITRSFAALLILCMLAVSIATTSVIGVQLVRTKAAMTNELLSALQRSFTGNKVDWAYWKDTAPINVRNTYARIQVHKQSGKTENFYLRRSKQFLAHHWRSWSLLPHIQYLKGQGIFYHVVKHVRYTDATTARFEVWLSCANILYMFRLVALIMLVATVCTLAIGLWVTSLLARRINEPLRQLTASSMAIASADTDYRDKLPLATNSLEVRDLSLAFNALLEKLNDQIRRDHEFVSDAAHELRTPLAAARGHAELIRRHGERHPEILPKSLDMIARETLKMQHLVESLLVLSRMDHAQLVFHPFDLTALGRQITATLQAQLPQDITFTAETQVLAYANAERIEQIVVALLENASKYAVATSTIRVSVTCRDGQAQIAVADHGVGVKDADKARIFNRFYRVDEARVQNVAGSGLGLSIAARMAALNNATITVTDNTPCGSIFTVTMPLAKQA